MNQTLHKSWRQYEAGKEYKRRLGLYEQIRRNERFYRGDQWQNGEGGDLPRPVFNLIRRVADYLIASVASARLSVRYSHDHLPYLADPRQQAVLRDGLDTVSRHTAWRWQKCGMEQKLFRLLTDAALTGDGVLYSYWDPSVENPQPFDGDIVTEVIDSVNLFVADVTRPDIQSQDYVILAGRATVASLRREAAEAGCTEDELRRIRPDSAEDGAGQYASWELEGEDEAKATYLIKFWREEGRVLFEKSTKYCVIRRARTDCRLYPVAYFSWIPVKNSFHGASPILAMIPNQQFINRAYAMVMKHMTDTAFSKVIYDKSKIPEWSNTVGEAIAAVGGGNIADAVSVVGVGQMQSGYMELIDSAVGLTKELMGATEAALGDADANNTSAILALQESSRVPLLQVRMGYYGAVEQLAAIWADMMCAYYTNDRLLCCLGEDGISLRSADFSLLKRGTLSAAVEVTEVTRYTASGIQSMLDKLLEGGHITASEYIRRLPDGLLTDRLSLAERLGDTPDEREEESA